MTIELTFAVIGYTVFGWTGLFVMTAVGLAVTCTTAAIVARVAR